MDNKSTSGRQTLRIAAQPHTYLLLASQTSVMLEKRWWCSVLVMASLSSAEFLNMRIRISRLWRYECSDEITSKMDYRREKRGGRGGRVCSFVHPEQCFASGTPRGPDSVLAHVSTDISLFINKSICPMSLNNYLNVCPFSSLQCIHLKDIIVHAAYFLLHAFDGFLLV